MKKPYEIPIKLKCLFNSNTLTASNGESAKEVKMLIKCQTSSSSSASNLSCSKQEPLSLTHQPNFETFSLDFFPCGAFLELACEHLVSLSFGVEETNCSQGIFELSNGHELLRPPFAFLGRHHKHRRLVMVQTR